MAEKVYECMFIFNANAYARNPGNASGGIKEMVESVGGELLASRMWNEQKLAYPVNGQRKGVYWLAYVKMAGQSVTTFNRACQLNDIILRHLVISIDPRLVDTLVAAANDTRPAGAAEEKVEEKSEAPAEKGSDDKKELKTKSETVAAE